MHECCTVILRLVGGSCPASAPGSGDIRAAGLASAALGPLAARWVRSAATVAHTRPVPRIGRVARVSDAEGALAVGAAEWTMERPRGAAPTSAHDVWHGRYLGPS